MYTQGKMLKEGYFVCLNMMEQNTRIKGHNAKMWTLSIKRMYKFLPSIQNLQQYHIFMYLISILVLKMFQRIIR